MKRRMAKKMEIKAILFNIVVAFTSGSIVSRPVSNTIIIIILFIISSSSNINNITSSSYNNITITL